MRNNTEIPPLQLKGSNFGIRIVFSPEISDDSLVENFELLPERAYGLPIGTGVALDFQARPCSEELIGRLLTRIIWPMGINVLAWLTSDERSAARLARAGFATTEPKVAQRKSTANSGTLILDRSIRSGQQEEHSGNVVLIGHLHSGAEILAGGSVTILGRLMGLVHAGRGGTDGVYVVAGSFESQQLRIGDKLCDQFGADVKWWKRPVVITLENDGLLLKEWKLEERLPGELDN